jgi:hypothetical protein
VYQIVTKEELTPVTDLFEVSAAAVAFRATAGQCNHDLQRTWENGIADN